MSAVARIFSWIVGLGFLALGMLVAAFLFFYGLEAVRSDEADVAGWVLLVGAVVLAALVILVGYLYSGIARIPAMQRRATSTRKSSAND